MPGRHSGDQVHKVKKNAAPSVFYLTVYRYEGRGPKNAMQGHPSIRVTAVTAESEQATANNTRARGARYLRTRNATPQVSTSPRCGVNLTASLLCTRQRI